MAGNFGGDAFLDCTAHGDVVNTAARMESVNILPERGFVVPNKPERRRLCKILGVNPSVLGFDGGVAA